ncbi:unnamed protein product, partial [Meganyctiphanes norvegica]
TDYHEYNWHDREKSLQDDNCIVDDAELQSIFIAACKSNRNTCLDIIIQRPKLKDRIRVAETDDAGKSGLRWAVEKEHDVIVEKLLNYFSGHCMYDLRFTLKKALKERHTDIIGFLLQQSFKSCHDFLDLFDLLHGAIILRDKDSARKLLDNDKYHLPVDDEIFEAICDDDRDIIYRNSRSEDEILVALVLYTASHNWPVAKRLLPQVQQSHSLIPSVMRAAAEHNCWEIINMAVTYNIVNKDPSYHERQELSKTLFESVRMNNDKIAFVLCSSQLVDPWPKIDEYGSSPLQEADARGLTKFISIFNKSHPPPNLIAGEENIIKAYMANKERTDKVFEIAKTEDPYTRNDGVKKLLSESSSFNTSLNANVRGQNGLTLMHLAASAEHNYSPTWSYRDINDLVVNQGGYINAVDCGGDTPLHYLCKGEGRCSPEWQCLANGMLELGADPRIRNHKGKLPEDYLEPQDEELRALLTEKRLQLNELPHPDSSEKIQLLEKLNTAATTTGNPCEIKELLKLGAPLESHGGFSGALHHAVTMGMRDATLLLLAAGASTCGLSSEGLTILQAVHRTPYLPAIIPSLIRDEYCISLKKELAQIPQERQYESLRNGIQNLMKDIEEKGNKAKWTCVSGETDEWQNFVDAAHFGLTHTCFFMCWENAGIGRTEQVKGHPLLAAVKESQINTVLTLCRDLKLNPYFIPGLDESQLPEGLITSMRELERETIENYHLRSMEKNILLANALDFLRHPNENSNHLCSFLRIVAELGLIHTLHEVRSICEIDLNTIIECSSNSQMLHIAALHGHRHMVEYLLFCGVPPDTLSNGGLTASHLAAIKGYKKCSLYLQMFSKSESKSNNKMTAKDFQDELRKLMRNVKLSLLSEEDEDTIFSDYDVTRTSRIHLEKKSIGMGIYSDILLQKYALENRVNFSLPENKKVKDAISNDISRLVKQIGCIDSRYEGRVVEAGSVSENIRLFLPDELDFNVELNNFSGLDGGNINILSREICKEKSRIYLKGESELEIYLHHKHNNEEMFSENNFIDYFYKATNSALKTFVFESPNISVIYPGIQKTRVGIALFLVWSEASQRVLLPSIDLVPTILANWPKDNDLNLLPKELQDMVADIPISIACYGSNHWRYCLSQIESKIISNLSEDKQSVILACKLLSGFLKTDWWYPDYYKNLYRVWNYIYLKVDSPVSYVIKTLFFKELSKHIDSDLWKKNHFFDRVISVFMGMVKYNEKGENMQATQVKSHLLPMYESQRFGDGAIDIIDFLRKLKDG